MARNPTKWPRDDCTHGTQYFRGNEPGKAKRYVRLCTNKSKSMKLAFTDGQAFITERSDMPIKTEYLLSKAVRKHARRKLRRSTNSSTDGSFQRRNSLPCDGGRGRKHGLLHPVELYGLRLRHRHSGNRHWPFKTAEPTSSSTPSIRTHSNRANEHTIQSFRASYQKTAKQVGPFGVMGGYMQPQGHFQVAINTIDYKLNPQAALDAPRWQWMKDKTVHVEPNFPNHLAQALARLGHDIVPTLDTGSFGRGQIIWRDPVTGVLSGGTESRTDGAIAVW